MSYSQEEIDAVVSQLVTTDIKRPLTAFGTRDTSSVYAQLQQQALNVFLNSEVALYYCLYLGKGATGDLIVDMSTTLEALIKACRSTLRATPDVSDISSIANATAGLKNLEATLGQRKTGVRDITQNASYKQFEGGVGRFLQGPGSTIKAGGEIAQTRKEAQAQIPILLTKLKNSYETLLQRLALLLDAESSYESVELPVLVAQSVISRARALLDARHESLSALPGSERAAVLRQTVLELLAAKALVRKYGTFAVPAAVRAVYGVGAPFSDAAHPANPAVLGASLFGPYPVVSSRSTNTNEACNYLDLWFGPAPLAKFKGIFTQVVPLDGPRARATAVNVSTYGLAVGDIVYLLSGPNERTRWLVDSFTDTEIELSGVGYASSDVAVSAQIYREPSTTIVLPKSRVANLEGQLAEPFLFSAGVSDEFAVSIDGAVTSIALTTGVALSAEALCGLLNGSLPATYTAEPYFSPTKFSGAVSIAPDGPGAVMTLPYSGNPAVRSFTPIPPLNIDLGIAVGDRVYVTKGANAGQLHEILSITSQTIHTTLVSGPAVTSSTLDTIELGNARRKVRIRHTNALQAINTGSTLQVSTSSSVRQNAANILGFFGSVLSRSYPSSVTELVSFIAATNTDVVPAVGQNKVIENALFTTDDRDARIVRCLRGIFLVDHTAGSPVTLSGIGFASTGVQVGDVVQLRTGPNANAILSVTAVTETTVSAIPVLPLSLDSGEGVTADIGPGFTSSVYGWLVQVNSGPNIGAYRVQAVDPHLPWRMQLDAVMPTRFVSSVETTFRADFGPEYLSLRSTDKTTSSQISSISLAHDTFFEPMALLTDPVTATGTTNWFRLPNTPATLSAGDTLETYTTSSLEPANTYDITSVQRASNLIQITPAIDSTVSWTFPEAPSLPPFARVTSSIKNTYSALKTGVESWQSQAVSSSYFLNLNARMNPLLTNTLPSASAVGDAIAYLYVLYERLSNAGAQQTGYSGTTLEQLLAAFTCPRDHDVDTLFRVLKERSAQRAIDLLSSGDFRGFFGCTHDGASYNGRVRELMRTLIRADMPVRKTSQADGRTRRMLASTEGVDYEYSDADNMS